jgi:type I restriction enzyme S subunit
MSALDEKSGTISPEERITGDVGGGYRQFKRGDVLFARITPSMQNGKCAIYRGATNYGYGSTEFHVIRPRNDVDARWIHRYLRTKEIRMEAMKHFTGTAGQQRVPAAFLRELTIPAPPESDQLEALGRIDQIVDTTSLLQAGRTKSAELSSAIVPAVLNQTFSSSS